jgi:hypothetical protein
VIRYDMPQRSPEWYAVRLGTLTASDASAIFAKGRGSDEAVTRRDLRCKLVAERLSGRAQIDEYTSDAIRHGIDTEPAARRCYEAERGILVEDVGFLAHDELAAGCSPDGLADEGLLELKAPKTATHLGYLRDPLSLVQAYRAQLAHALWISGAPWIDIASFDNRLPPKLQFVVVRIERASVDLAGHEAAVRKFLDEVDRDVAALQGFGVMQEV